MEFFTLKNGVRVILVPMPGVQSLAAGVYVGTGSRYETQANNGISHFTEHLVFKGTKKFPTTKDVSFLEGLGGVQNAATSLDYTYFYCKVPGDKWRQGLEIVKELALNPLFPAPDLEVERGVILEELKWANDRPDELIGDVMQRCLYPNHPLGMTVLGQETVLKSLKREDFVAYHEAHYTPDNMVVALSGKIPDIAEVRAQVEEWFGGLTSTKTTSFVPFKDTQVAPQIELETRSTLQQSFIALAVRGVTVSDPKRFPLAVLDSYLGHGFTSRFHQEIREKRGLCYSISSGDAKLADTGYWTVMAGLNTARLEEAIEAILEEMRLVEKNLISATDLEQTKEKIRGPLIFSMENPIHQMNFYAKQILDRPNEILTYDEVVDRLMGVRDIEIQSLAQELFQTEKLNLALVAPFGEEKKADLLKLLAI